MRSVWGELNGGFFSLGGTQFPVYFTSSFPFSFKVPPPFNEGGGAGGSEGLLDGKATGDVNGQRTLD